MPFPGDPAQLVIDEDDDLALWNAAPPRRVIAPPPPVPSDSSSESNQAESEDTAAEAKLKDHNEVISLPEEPKAKPPVALPGANDAFTAVAGPPAFLDPEATRQLPTFVHQGSSREAEDASTREGAWDISNMAPKLPGEQEEKPGVVVSAQAKRYKAADGEAVEVTPAQLAMLGQSSEGKKDAKGKGSKAMGVEEFLEKGVGGAALPRKRQDRKEKEKAKAEKGIRSHAGWKTEAEMLLRQQYD